MRLNVCQYLTHEYTFMNDKRLHVPQLQAIASAWIFLWIMNAFMRLNVGQYETHEYISGR